MFTIYFYNFNYSRHALTLEDAISSIANKGFQCSILNPEGQTVASYCPLNGLTVFEHNQKGKVDLTR
jgi:hypothetical protein